MRKLVGQPQLIRSVNRSIILEAVQRFGPISRAEIVRKYGLSAPTVSNVVAELLVEGLLLEKGVQNGTGVGRNPVLLEFNPHAGLAVALDLSRTPPVGALVDLDGNIEKEEALSVGRLRGESIVQRLCQFIVDVIKQASQEGRKLIGIGVGVPGVISSQESGDLVWAPGLELRQFPLSEILAGQLDLKVPILVENDVNLAVLGENWKGIGVGKKNLVLVAAAEGIGAGIIINGKLYRGADGAAGEIGYFGFGHDSPDAQFRKGPLESRICVSSFLRRAAFLSSVGVQRTLEETLESSVAPSMVGFQKKTFLSVEDVFRAAENGDAGARQACDELASALGVALANLACVLNPELIILGGDYSNVSPWFIESLRDTLAASVPYPPRVEPARLGRSALFVGILRHLLFAESIQLTLTPL